jgi:two-component system response regulator DegU
MNEGKAELTSKKVMLADDHALFREGLKRILADAGFKKIVEATNGQEAIDLAIIERPDLILMEIYMPAMNGVEATRHILKKFPDIVIVILTVCEEDKFLAEALLAGAQGYLTKSMRSYQIIESLNNIIKGNITFSIPFTRNLLYLLSNNKIDQNSKQPYNNFDTSKITQREKEVIIEMAKGHSNKEISQLLFISEHTVKNHVRNILDKLNVKSRTHAVSKALAMGIIPPYHGSH